MEVGERKINKIFKALLEKQNYIALANIIRICPNPLDILRRYLFLSGNYPLNLQIKVPTGTASFKLFNRYDILTFNEIFCRNDYYAKEDIKVVVDIGSNIGISALYFLTRNKQSKCYLFEPVTENTKKLCDNLSDFNGRFTLEEVAVSDKAGILDFGVEDTGRYGGIGVKTGKQIKVRSLNINSVLEEILKKEEIIDILKLDIEGAETRVVLAIEDQYLARIKAIYFENIGQTEQTSADFLFHPKYFKQKQYGSTCQLHSTYQKESVKV